MLLPRVRRKRIPNHTVLSKKTIICKGMKQKSLPKKRKTSIQYPEPGSNRHSLAATGV